MSLLQTQFPISDSHMVPRAHWEQYLSEELEVALSTVACNPTQKHDVMCNQESYKQRHIYLDYITPS